MGQPILRIRQEAHEWARQAKHDAHRAPSKTRCFSIVIEKLGKIDIIMC